MRKPIPLLAVLACMIQAGSASAAEPAPSAPTAAPGAPDEDARDITQPVEPVGADITPDEKLRFEDDKPPKRPWEVGAAINVHRLARQNDLAGAARNKQVNYLDIFGSYDITPNDSVMLQWGFYERFMADNGETGFRTDDILLSYTRRFALPYEIGLKITPSFTIPISFASRKASTITDARLLAKVDRKFGDFDLAFGTYGVYSLSRYRSMEGGAANSHYSAAVYLNGEYNVPFHRPLSTGLYVRTGYSWQHDVRNSEDNPLPYRQPVDDPQFDGQPVQQTYGGQLYARYDFPELFDAKTDFTVGYGMGSPVLGYTSINHDGVSRLYLGWRHTSQFYMTLSARY